jgi:hypothetical protein
MEGRPKNESPESRLIQKYGLRPGAHVQLEKVALLAESPVPVGSRIEGKIQNEVKLGDSIEFDNGARISAVKNIQDMWGQLFIRTETSVYWVRQENTAAEPFTFSDIDSVETARGSVYRYLPDGMTQRFKKAENSLRPPKDALVYVPDYEWVKENAPQEELVKLGDDETEYEDTLLGYVHDGNREIYITDLFGKKLGSNREIESADGPIYLVFISNGKQDFSVPVSHTPKIGYSTYDMAKYYDQEEQKWMRRRHLGNKTVKITLKDGREITEPSAR